MRMDTCEYDGHLVDGEDHCDRCGGYIGEWCIVCGRRVDAGYSDQCLCGTPRYELLRMRQGLEFMVIALDEALDEGLFDFTWTVTPGATGPWARCYSGERPMLLQGQRAILANFREARRRGFTESVTMRYYEV